MQQGTPQPSYELPAPLPPQEGDSMSALEQQPASPERALVPAVPPLVAQPAPVPSSIPHVAPILPPQSLPIAAPTTTPLAADDNDLIEKEWVLKAKQIVAATHEDPYTQNKEISKFKADYLKKRYNKDLKLEES